MAPWTAITEARNSTSRATLKQKAGDWRLFVQPPTGAVLATGGRSGGITRFSPTPPRRPPPPTSPTAATPSSKRPSPTSSTAPWPTSLPDASAPTVPGPSARGSPTTCYAPPRPWPGHAIAPPGGPPCAVTWSTSRPAWPDPNDDRSCTYPGTGHGNRHGQPCGTTSSATDPAPEPPTTRPDNQDPDRKSWTDQRPLHAHHQPESRSTAQPATTQSIGGIRLNPA